MVVQVAVAKVMGQAMATKVVTEMTAAKVVRLVLTRLVVIRRGGLMFALTESLLTSVLDALVVDFKL